MGLFYSGCMAGTSTVWAGILGALFFALACFVFSAIFWGTYLWAMRKNRRKK